MKITHLTPGTGNFHCGSCLRDNDLIKALRKMGHDVHMVPLYLPLVTDDEAASPELPVFAGGINLFLRQKLPFLKKLPRVMTAWLDSRPVLMLGASLAGMTSARELGEMTLESLRGTNGKQGEDWKKLIDWIGATEKPDLVSFSNGLLNGLAPAVRRDLGVPVVCSLQGEDSFLDTLPDSHRERAWDAFRANSGDVDSYVATSEYYSAEMRRRLQLPDHRVRCVRNGMNLSAFTPPAAPPAEPVIGFLARLCKGKGLDTLVEAFILLAPRVPAARLALGGTCTSADNAFIAGLERRIAAVGLTDRVIWRKNMSLSEKVDHLRGLTVLSVPATYGEAFGLYVLEALACGVPVVQPDHAGPAELVRATGGGLLCAPDDPAALANALERVLTNPDLRRELSETGRAAALRDFNSDRMAADFAAVCEDVLAARKLNESAPAAV